MSNSIASNSTTNAMPERRALLLNFKSSHTAAGMEQLTNQLRSIGWIAAHQNLDDNSSLGAQIDLDGAMIAFLATENETTTEDEVLLVAYAGLAFRGKDGSPMWHAADPAAAPKCPAHTSHINANALFEKLSHTGKKILFILDCPFDVDSSYFATWRQKQASHGENVQVLAPMEQNTPFSPVRPVNCGFSGCLTQERVDHPVGMSSEMFTAFGDLLQKELREKGEVDLRELVEELNKRAQKCNLHSIVGRAEDLVLRGRRDESEVEGDDEDEAESEVEVASEVEVEERKEKRGCCACM